MSAGADDGPTVTATLGDGPCEGRRLQAPLVAGRPPATLDVAADDGSTCRYVLVDLIQTDRAASYTFLYTV